MSNYFFAFFRTSLQSDMAAAMKKKLEKIPSFRDAKQSTYESDRKKIYTWQETDNISITTSLDFRLKLPGLPKTKYSIVQIRELENEIEITSDTIGDRTIWYYYDKECLLVASTQMSIIAALGSYEPNMSAWTWMLSNGCLGPGLSWDARIRALRPGATLFLDEEKWQVQEILKPWEFSTFDGNYEKASGQLRNLLNEVATDYQLPGKETLLTLSGGYDSRAALYLLKNNNPDIRTATWGIPEAFKTPFTDASVAKQVSVAWKTAHSEYDVQLQTDFDAALDTFLEYSEGRNDHINSFMDGLQMWKTMAASGIQYVVRADEAFGWLPVQTELDARASVAMAHFSDFKNIPHSLISDLPPQKIPDYLQRKNTETVENYRDRLYQEYRLPFVIGPLQDIPLSFVEIVNPLLHPDLIKFVRTLPSSLRTNKKLYADWVDTLLPEIPYANRPAIPEAFQISSSLENRDIFMSFFSDADAILMLGQPLMTFLMKNWKPKEAAISQLQSGFRQQVAKRLPFGMKKFLRNKVTGYQLPVESLGLRAFLIYKMQRILKEVAK